MINEKYKEDVNANLFTNALKYKFHSSGVYPVVFGAYGESDATTSHLIKKCTKLAAARAEMRMSHL